MTEQTYLENRRRNLGIAEAVRVRMEKRLVRDGRKYVKAHCAYRPGQVLSVKRIGDSFAKRFVVTHICVDAEYAPGRAIIKAAGCWLDSRGIAYKWDYNGIVLNGQHSHAWICLADDQSYTLSISNQPEFFTDRLKGVVL